MNNSTRVLGVIIFTFFNKHHNHLKRPLNFYKWFDSKSKKTNMKEVFQFNQDARQLKLPLLLMWTLPFLSSTKSKVDGGETKPWPADQRKEIKKAIQEADELFESNNYEHAAATLLPYKESGDVEVLWRLSKALYNQAQSSTETEAEKRSLIEQAYEAVCEAIRLDDAHWAVHKWMSVLLDAHASYDGIKARISQLDLVKSHMLRAAELNPSDATTLYMLGSWCYQIADMSWVQRKIAATIFAEPPQSSFEEALDFFTRAEKIQPRFYSQNLLMLGKTLLKLQKPSEAVQYLSLAKDYPSSSEEDDLVRKEATEMLKKININNKYT